MFSQSCVILFMGWSALEEGVSVEKEGTLPRKGGLPWEGVCMEGLNGGGACMEVGPAWR